MLYPNCIILFIELFIGILIKQATIKPLYYLRLDNPFDPGIIRSYGSPNLLQFFLTCSFQFHLLPGRMFHLI